MAKQKSIKTKIAVLAGLCLVATAASTIGAGFLFSRSNNAFVSRSVSELIDSKTRESLRELAANQAALLRAEFDEALHAARNLADIFAIVGAPHGNSVAMEMRRKVMLDILHKTLEANPAFNGTYSAWEPNAVDGRDAAFVNSTFAGSDATGRFLPYWTRDPKSGLIALQPLVEYDSRDLHPNGVMKGGWYIGPKETGRESVLGPLPYIVQGKSVFLATLSVPIVSQGRFLGVAGTDFNLDFVQTLAAKASASLFGGKNTVVILSDLGLVVADSKQADQIGKSFAGRSATWDADLALIKAGKDSLAWSADGKTLRIFQPIPLGRTEKPWMVLITVPRDVVMAEADALSAALSDRAATSASWQAGVGIGITVLAILAVWLTAAGVSRPIISMTGAMRRLAEGDLEAEVPARGQADEIGQMAEAVQVFKDNAIEVRRLQEEQERQKERAAVERKEAMNALAASFEANVMGIVESVSRQSADLTRSAEILSSATDLAEQQASAVAAASEQASVNVQTVASATNELSASIQEISRQILESARIAATAVDESKRADQIVSGLSEAAQKIGEVVDLITDIANQTNLLALNATIEAARAGDMGKGFAVVAGEVKNLASQTAKATEEIGSQIGGVQSATGDAVTAIQGIAATIGQIDEISTAISSAIEEQGAATQEIARNVQQAAAGVGDVSTNIVSVTQATSESGGASAQVLAAARQLSDLAEKLREDVVGFIATVRNS